MNASPALRKRCATLLSFCCAFANLSTGAAPADPVQVRFREVDTLFPNPGQGWMSQQRTPRSEPRFPCSVVCIRFNWADVEPEPGQYHWRLIDDVITAWKPRDAAVAFMLTNHVTLINDNVGRVPPEAMPQLERLARLVLRELSHPAKTEPGANLDLQMTWANVGVGKLHRAYVPRFFLLNSNGECSASLDGQADPRTWLPGEHRVTERLSLPSSLTPGRYTLALSLVLPQDHSRPFRLAIDAPEQDGRYALRTLEVAGPK